MTAEEKANLPIKNEWNGESEKSEIDSKIARLLELTDEFIFPSYYSHTEKTMWKIVNVYSKFGSITFVLCGVEEGISKALDLAINAIDKARKEYYKSPI